MPENPDFFPGNRLRVYAKPLSREETGTDDGSFDERAYLDRPAGRTPPWPPAAMGSDGFWMGCIDETR